MDITHIAITINIQFFFKKAKMSLGCSYYFYAPLPYALYSPGYCEPGAAWLLACIISSMLMWWAVVGMLYVTWDTKFKLSSLFGVSWDDLPAKALANIELWSIYLYEVP